MSCHLHNDFSCSGCEKEKSIAATNELNNIIDGLIKEKADLVAWLEFSYDCSAQHAEDPDDDCLPSSIYGEVLKKIKELKKGGGE